MANFFSTLIFWFTAWLYFNGQTLGANLGVTNVNVHLDNNDEPAENVTVNIHIPPCKCAQPPPQPCNPNPCKYGGVCSVTDDLKDYKCDCQYPMGGRKCEELKCKTTCFRLDSTVFFVYSYDMHTHFARVYNKCMKEGHTMVMLKDKRTHEYVRDKLTALFADRPDVYQSHYIGLNRTSTSGPFTWADGTPLQYHDGWFEGHPIDRECVSIANTRYGFKFLNEPCYWDGTAYFPMCQQTFPFLNA